MQQHCRRLWSALSLGLLAVGLCPRPATAAPGRDEVSLNGQWETAAADTLDDAPAAEARWEPFTVPGTRRSIQGEKRWFRTRFQVPAEWQGRRIFLRYDGAKYDSRHRLNGTVVGRHLRGYDRFEFDVTSAARSGAENELLLGCADWQATFAEPVDLTAVPATQAARDVPRNVGLTPVGGLFYEYGPWADVTLVAVSPVHLATVAVTTSVRQHTLGVRATLRNAGGASARARVGGRIDEEPAVSLPPQEATIAPGQAATLTWTVPWPNPKLWTFDTPDLYHLTTTLEADDGSRDAQHTRFGFREFECDGPAFRLNGTRLLLRSSAMWPLPEKTREEAAGRLRKLKAINVICFRTHTQPWRQYWYEAADEVGMLMIPEGPVFNDDTFYRLGDARFWDNYAAELRSMVERVRNHPSVVALSLENEFFGSALSDATPAPKAELAKLGRLVREWDPTRPFMYESDGDPEGVADIEGIHYPHELGEAFLYPETAYWLDQPKRIPHAFMNGAETWTWKRAKPLYIGEYLWCPCPTPDLYTIFQGDQAYTDRGQQEALAIGEAWRTQTRAYRVRRVSGLCPWTCAGGSLDARTDPMAAAQAEAMRPLAAFAREYTTRFVGGTTITRTLDVMNDTLHGGEVTVTLTLEAAGSAPAEARQTLRLEPADLQALTLSVPAPTVPAPTPAVLRIRAAMPGAPDFEDTIACRLYPPPRIDLPAGTQVGWLAPDPADHGRQFWEACGVRTVPVTDLAAIPPEMRVLVIGENALATTGAAASPQVLRLAAGPDPARPLLDFLAGGGRVLVLPHTRPHAPLGPLAFVNQPANLVFPLWPGHPALAGVAEEDLRYWAPDHRVATAQVARDAAGVRAILVSGSQGGIAFSPLAECEVGRGRLLLCGLDLTPRLTVEPVAATLAGNLLRYLATAPPPAAPVLTAIAQGPAVAALAHTGLAIPTVDSPAALPATATGNVLLAAPADDAAVGALLDRVCGRGATLWWHTPDPAQFARLMAARGLAARLSAAAGPVRLAEADPWTDGLARADLWWPAPQTPGAESWQDRGTDPAIIEAALDPGVSPDPAQAMVRLAAADLTPSGSEWNRLQGDSVVLAARGSVSAEFAPAVTGPAVLGFEAKGSPCADGWPQVVVALNGKTAGVVTVASREWGLFGVLASLRPGTNRVELRFVNDASSATEDRNVYFRQVLVQKSEKDGIGATAHTVPAALASVRVGPGTLLVDTLRWDTAGPHAAKGRRLACWLALRLGAHVVLRPFTSVAAAEQEYEKAPFNQPRDGHLTLANVGSVWVRLQSDRDTHGRLVVRARGSSALDEWPILSAKLDDRDLGRITVSAVDFEPFALPLDVPAGEHRLELRFINDFCDPGRADRNVDLDRIGFEEER